MLGKTFLECEKTDPNMVFWMSPKNIQLKNYHFAPASSNNLDMWAHYLEDKNNEDIPQTYIYYKNATANKEYKSGITLDSDLYIYINEKDYIITNTSCSEHEDPDPECEECQECQSKIKKELNKKSETQIIEKFKKFVIRHPFVPNYNDLKVMEQMCTELTKFIQERFKIQYNEFFTEEDIGNYILLCRDNIDTSRCKDREGHNYYRYGFHIYFFDFKMDGEAKKYIKNHFSFSKQLRDKIHDYYPNTQIGEIFDLQPLVGTTSLPLSWNGSSSYSCYYDKETKDLEDIMGNETIKNNLNPFRGQQIHLKPEYVQLNQEEINLVTLLQQREIPTYEESLKHIRNNLKQFKEDFQFKLLLENYNHPPHEKRENIVRQLYGYLFDEKKVAQSLLIIQECMFLILAEDLEDVFKKEKYKPTPDWIEANKDRNRYPIKIVELVQRVHEQQSKQKKQMDKAFSYKKLFDTYNKYKLDNKLEDDMIKFDPLMQISYKNFMNFIQDYQNGIYVDNFFTMINKPRFRATVQDILFQYAYLQMEANMIVCNEKFYYFQQSDNDQNQSYDNNKFHEIQNGEIEGRVVSIFNKLKYGLSQQMKTMKDDFDNYNYYKQYFGMTPSKQEDFLEEADDEVKMYISQFEKYMDLQSTINDFMQKSKTKSTVQQLVIEKLSWETKQQQIDLQQDCIGVFNGILEFNHDTLKFQFHQGRDAKKFSVSKTTMFQIRQEFLDQNSLLVEPEDLPDELKAVYDDIVSIFDKIYNNGKDIEILHWKIYNILIRMLLKNIPAEKLLIAFGTGGDGKTTAMQAICNVLGQGPQSLGQGSLFRKIVSSGYAAQGKSNMLQTRQSKSSQHDSGGMSELESNFFCLMTELASQDPLVASAIKQLFCGTQIVARKAQSPDIKTFFNACFMELQTNYYPVFDQVLDEGLARRILFYQHCVKFLSKEAYEQLNENQKQHYAIADENVRNKLTSDFTYIDVLGYYLLKTFENFPNRSLDYIPDIIQVQTKSFLQSSLLYMRDCLKSIEKSDSSYILYDDLELQMKELIETKLKESKKKNIDYDQIQSNHISAIKNLLMKDMSAFNLETKERFMLTENEFQNYATNPKYIIILQNFKFSNEDLQDDTETNIRSKLKNARKLKLKSSGSKTQKKQSNKGTASPKKEQKVKSDDESSD